MEDNHTHWNPTGDVDHCILSESWCCETVFVVEIYHVEDKLFKAFLGEIFRFSDKCSFYDIVTTEFIIF